VKGTKATSNKIPVFNYLSVRFASTTMNARAKEVLNITKNGFGKYVHSKLVYTLHYNF